MWNGHNKDGFSGEIDDALLVDDHPNFSIFDRSLYSSTLQKKVRMIANEVSSSQHSIRYRRNNSYSLFNPSNSTRLRQFESPTTYIT